MIDALTISQAADLLISDQYANWSRAGATALVEDLEELEESVGESIEFDAVGIRCEYTEYADWEEVRENYDECPEDEDDALEWAQDNTVVIEFDGGIILQDF